MAIDKRGTSLQNGSSIKFKKDELKKSNQTKLKNIESTNLYNQRELKRVHSEREKDIQDNANTRISKIDTKTQKIIEDLQRQFRRDVKDLNQDRVSSINETKRKYQRQLSNLKDSFDKTVKEESEFNQNQRNSLKENFDQTLSSNQNKYEKSLDSIKEKFYHSLESGKEGLSKEKVDLIKKFSSQNAELARQSSAEKEKLRSYHDNRFDEFKERKNLELQKKSEAQQQALRAFKYDGQGAIAKLNENYRRGIEELQRRSSNDLSKQQRDFVRTIKEQRDAHAKELYLNNKKTNEVIEHHVESADIDVERSRLKDIFNRRIQNREDQVIDLNAKFEKDISELKSSLNEELRERNLEHRRNLDKKTDEFSDTLLKNSEAARKKHSQTVSQYQREKKNTEVATTEKFVGMTRQHEETLQDRRKAYGDSLTKLSDDNDQNVRTMQADFAKEKNIISSKYQNRLDQQSNEHKEATIKNNEKMEDDFYDLIMEKDKRISRLEEENEFKLASIGRTARRRADNESTLNREARESQRKAYDTSINNTKKHYEGRMKRLMYKSRNDLMNAKKDYESEVTKLTYRHQNETEKMISEHQIELARKTTLLKDQLIQQKESDKFLFDTTVQNYENRIKNMRRDFEMKRASDYRDSQKLS